MKQTLREISKPSSTSSSPQTKSKDNCDRYQNKYSEIQVNQCPTKFLSEACVLTSHDLGDHDENSMILSLYKEEEWEHDTKYASVQEIGSITPCMMENFTRTQAHDHKSEHKHSNKHKSEHRLEHEVPQLLPNNNGNNNNIDIKVKNHIYNDIMNKSIDINIDEIIEFALLNDNY